MDGNVNRAATELYPTVKADVFAFLKIVLERRGRIGKVVSARSKLRPRPESC